MTDNESLIIRYLQRFPGQWVNYCRMLNTLARCLVDSRGVSCGRKSAINKEWVELRRAANRLIVGRKVVRKYLSPQSREVRGKEMVRIHAACEYRRGR